MAKQMNLLSRVRRQVRRRGQEAGAISLIHLGATYAGAIVLYCLGGIWLDGKLGTSPLFTLLGAGLGGVGGFIWVYREVLRAEAKAKAAKLEPGDTDTGSDSRTGGT
jgi:F0F1-type ATP synthase assembly protein I